MEALTRKNLGLGRHVYGIAVCYFGLVSFPFHNYNDWLQLQSLERSSGGTALIYVAASCMIAGGLTIQWSKAARAGAGLLTLVSLFFTARWIPGIISHPLVFDYTGNFFEQASILSGALMIFATATPHQTWSDPLARSAYVVFSICVISFTLGQAIYLNATASFVPSWIPPGQMFWAVITTIAFALAAIALITGIQALLAARLLTLMIVGFGVLVWLPRLISEPQMQLNWGGNGENMAIAGAAWIVVDYLSDRALKRRRTGESG